MTRGWLGPALRRHELRVLAVVVLLAFAARVWRLDHTSINHYDEGVYAFTAWGLADAGRPIHPEQRNSPIGLAFLSSLVFRAIGPTDLAPLGVNVTLGTLSVVALWLVGRRWFGPTAGIAAASLLACNEFHISMSRSGMTDVLFVLLFVVGVPVVSAALLRPGVWTTLAGALVTAAAWNTKSHGWLTAVTATSGLVPYALFAGWTAREYLGAVRRLAVITIVATACYIPWFMIAAVQAGGYDQLAAYQWSFLDPHVLDNARRQAWNLTYFDGMLTRASVPAALAAIAFLVPRATRGLWLMASVGAAAAGLAFGGAVALAVLTAVAVPLLMRSRDLGAWTLLAWGALFLVLIPVYNPYVRTTLPLVVALCVGAGVALAAWAERPASADDAEPGRPWQSWATLALAVLVVAVGYARGETSRWRESRDLPEAARVIREAVGPGTRVIVIGEAALAFYLETEGVRAFKGFEYWETVVAETQPTYVVTGVYIERAPTLRKNYAILKDRLELLAEYPFFPDDARLLETFRPHDARAILRDRRGDYTLRLFRYTPDPSGRVPQLVRF